MFKNSTTYQPEATLMAIRNDMAICQSDYPLDWYQEDFIPYAQEYQALPDRKLTTVLNWMKPYLTKAQNHFGNKLLLLAHYYMGGEIVRLIEQFGGKIGDSYQLALMAANNPEKSVIVESAVHFMAESISILANENQHVYITNPKSGCTMEMLAKDFMVEPAFLDLNERYGAENILPVCYMNTSGRVKAMTGAQGGAVCTSSNVKKIFQWAQKQNKKILFIPDQHMGENVAYWLGIKNLAYWPGGTAGANYSLPEQDKKTLKQFDKAELILFASQCAVHTHYQPEMCDYWKSQGYTTIVHPECRNDVIKVADYSGSTAFIWDLVVHDKAGTKSYAIGTENHMVENLKQYCKNLGIRVVNLAEAPQKDTEKGVGCGCATMSRNDPPHLVALLDLLRQGKSMPYNEVKAGDVVNEFTGTRNRLPVNDQQWVINNAKKALEMMINITEDRV
ncbi:TPA: quinolinate synthase NadA [Legionella pneumophila subsp. pneumophila]|uniref:quinolinate synthase n=1 Tax=Legionella pneumophila (strain Lens) TaxID=297245 RepID=Q5WYA7_LEGPL|nr:quinolinate synthase NadA [Legionella pneumophila]AOW52534.1 quinolinate synthetase [Legionella pneumophila subsp. pneumophila]AOW53875.1 quinolinate synthetase [Legionella pneumophila subsp. pneumophila]AOW57826.1 quinolinate synthetase [Legionella pneumophila subsp. pneumophila]AOW61990.1 quinolinate synthetase [Legionella pneumophila subsp. pneumophila]AOW63331.1 quinolinate synthetase [Legionella pneumophila subsp. pneumophila]